MKKQAKRKFVLSIDDNIIKLIRRNKRNQDNMEGIFDIFIGIFDIFIGCIESEKYVEVSFGNLFEISMSDHVYNVDVKSNHYLKYIRKISRATFAFVDSIKQIEKWES